MFKFPRSVLPLGAVLAVGGLAAMAPACSSSNDAVALDDDAGSDAGIDATGPGRESGAVDSAIDATSPYDSSMPDEASTSNEGGPEGAPDDGPATDGPADAHHDAPHEAGFVMAAHPPLPAVVFNAAGGPKGSGVLAAPKVVTIDVSTDPNAAPIEALAKSYASSTFWDTIRPGFCDPDGGPCVGDGPEGTVVSLPSAPEVDSGHLNPAKYIVDGIASKLLPAPDASSPTNTIYMLVLPEGYKLPGLCSDYFGYHSWVEYKGQLITYALIGECPSYSMMTTLELTTQTVNHEITEATTDPASGYRLVASDINNAGWESVLGGGGEVGDLCDWFSTKGRYWPGENWVYSSSAGSLSIQRIWSPLAAAAGGDPCLPIPTGVTFFQVAPPQQVYVLDVGTSLTIDAYAYSTAEVPDWTLAVGSYSGALEVSIPGVPTPDAGLPTTTVNNGDRPKITLKLVADPGTFSDAGVLERGKPAIAATFSSLGPVAAPKAAYEWGFAVMTPADAMADGLDSGLSMRPDGEEEAARKALYDLPAEAHVRWVRSAPGL